VAYANVGLRALLCAVFAVSAISKLRHPEVRDEIAHAIGQLLPFVGRTRSERLAFLVVGLELAVVGLLVAPRTDTTGLAAALGLLCIFTAAVGWGLFRGRRIRCRCFGLDGSEAGVGHLTRNASLIVIAGAGLISAGAHGGESGGGTALAVGVGLLLGLIATRWDDLAFLVSSSSDDTPPPEYNAPSTWLS